MKDIAASFVEVPCKKTPRSSFPLFPHVLRRGLISGREGVVSANEWARWREQWKGAWSHEPIRAAEHWRMDLRGERSCTPWNGHRRSSSSFSRCGRSGRSRGTSGEDGGAERARYGQTCPKRMSLCPSPCSPLHLPPVTLNP